MYDLPMETGDLLTTVAIGGVVGGSLTLYWRAWMLKHVEGAREVARQFTSPTSKYLGIAALVIGLGAVVVMIAVPSLWLTR